MRTHVYTYTYTYVNIRKHIRTIAIATAVSRPKAEGGCKTQPNQSQTALKSVPNRSKIDLGGVWRVSEPSWMVLGASRHHLGAVSGRPGGVLELLGATWGRLGGVLGASWGRPGSVQGASWDTFANLFENRCPNQSKIIRKNKNQSQIVPRAIPFRIALGLIFCFEFAEEFEDMMVRERIGRTSKNSKN